MRLFSGISVTLLIVDSKADTMGRTQSSLDEGVSKMKDIYKSYNDVGIKDRSMIWNSYVYPFHWYTHL